MNFFKKLSETVMGTASSIGSKSADLVEAGKLKLQKNKLEGIIMDKKTGIGDLVYLAHQQNLTPDMDALSLIFAEIMNLENQIGLVDEKLRKETTQTAPPVTSSKAPASATPTAPSCDFIFCSQCGQKLSTGAKFCNNCGQAQ